MGQHLDNPRPLPRKARRERQKRRIAVAGIADNAVCVQCRQRVFGHGDCCNAGGSQLDQHIVHLPACRVRQRLRVAVVHHKLDAPVPGFRLPAVRRRNQPAEQAEADQNNKQQIDRQ